MPAFQQAFLLPLLLAGIGQAALCSWLIPAALDLSDGADPLQAVAVALLFLALARLCPVAAPRAAAGGAVPGPGRGLPLVGATVQLLVNWDRVLDFLCEWQQQAGWGKVWGFTTMRMGGMADGTVVLATPQAVEHVLKTNFENYEKGVPFRAVLGDFLGSGIFASDGERWRHHRKVAAQMFSKRLLQEGTAVAQTNCRALLDRLDAAAESGEPFELQSAFFAFTMDTFAELAFGASSSRL
jgi:hypothetical protein